MAALADEYIAVCEYCDGTGKIGLTDVMVGGVPHCDADDQPCPDCDGYGYTLDYDGWLDRSRDAAADAAEAAR